jgi:NADPH:quinone reductase-like Zn-dependent oxidoreductase
MEAAYVTELGVAGDIRVGRLPAPVPGPGEALVRVEAVSANHVDTFVRSGAYATELAFPFVIGRDLVGTADGERVWCNSLGYDGRQGSFAEYAAVPEDRLYRLPDGVDPVEAVAVLHTGATAYLGLFRDARIKPGEWIFVGGAGGGVGSAVVQLASAAGARVIAVDRAENAEWCRESGASEFFDRDDPDLAGKILGVAPSGVDVYWDNSGHHDFERVLPLLARGGRLILMAGLRAKAMLPVGAVYTRDIGIHGFAISNASATDLGLAAETINRELASGRLRGRIRAKLALSDAADAHRRLETRDHRDPPGRIVLIT